jgi:hypothetical protein
MNCPHCQQPLPEKYGASYCPHCGGAVQPQDLLVAIPQLRPIKINYFLIFGALLFPPLLTMLVAFLGSGHSNEQASPAIAFFGGAAGGIASGIMLALRLGRTTGTRVLLGILFSAVFVVVCVMLSFFGCMIGGYQFTF